MMSGNSLCSKKHENPGGVPCALDGTGRPLGVCPRRRKCRTVTFRSDGRPYGVTQAFRWTVEDGASDVSWRGIRGIQPRAWITVMQGFRGAWKPILQPWGWTPLFTCSGGGGCTTIVLELVEAREWNIWFTRVAGFPALYGVSGLHISAIMYGS